MSGAATLVNVRRERSVVPADDTHSDGEVRLGEAANAYGQLPNSLGRRPRLVDGVRTPTVAETVVSGFLASSEETRTR
jgi:hypothetical protein